jgi:hypothetical protein
MVLDARSDVLSSAYQISIADKALLGFRHSSFSGGCSDLPSCPKRHVVCCKTAPMPHDPIFDSVENQALLVVCARKAIRTGGIIGIVWGAINLVIGFFAIQIDILNVGILVLALVMLGAGVAAIKKPSLPSLLSGAIVSVLLLCWNIGIVVVNARTGYNEHINAHGLVWPAIAAVIFVRQYFKLGHLKEAISAMDRATVKEASVLCKLLFRSKIKQSADIVEASSKRCRVKLMTNSVFCAQRNLARAFHMSRASFQQCIRDVNKPRIRVVVRHPLGKLTYAFDRKNSEKIKSWLTALSSRTS